MYNKNKLYSSPDCWSKDMLNLDFLLEGLGLASSPHFVYDFSKNNFFHAIFYLLIKLDCLAAFTSKDVGQYV